MKFCKTLQRAVEISDPSYVPYWTNYKRLKKLVKALIPEATAPGERTAGHDQQEQHHGGGRLHDEDKEEHHSQETTTKRWESAIHEVLGERLMKSEEGETRTATATATTTTSSGGHERQQQQQQHESSRPHYRRSSSFQQRKKELESNPREVEFFELLHAEFSKASAFFDKVQQQFIIREEIVSVGMRVLRSPQTTSSSNIAAIAPQLVRGGLVNNKNRWGLLSKAVFLLYRDLLLFEVFAIMTYFAFSKILKKHDKVTGYQTRGAFMVNVVNKV
jgi:SPX domain protein involved in polyphosphate accumulation